MGALDWGAISMDEQPKRSWPSRTFDKCQRRRQIESTINRMQSDSSLPRPRRPPRPLPASIGFKMANLWLIQQVLMTTIALASGQLHDSSPVQRRSTDAETQQVARGAQGSGCQAQTMGHLANQLQQDGQQQQQEAASTAAGSKKLFCFYDIQDDFRPQDLNPCLCTHVVYSYVAVRRNLSFIAGKKGDLRSLASLKRKNPHLKLLVSLRPDDFFSFDSLQTVPNDTNQHQQAAPLVGLPPEQTDGGGGQYHQTPVAIATNSSTLQSDELLRQQLSINRNQTPMATGVAMNEMHQKFAKRIRDFIVRHSLDGINLDWPYFAQVMASGSPKLMPNETREHLGLILQAINENFQLSWSQSSPSAAYLRQQAPIVTLTVSKDFYSLVDGYNFHQINSLVDFVHLPAFDFDLNVDQYSIGHPARLHGIYDAENLDTLVDLLLSSGLPSDQLIAGIPTHGVQITSKPTAIVEFESNGTSSSVNLSDQLEAAANISIVSHSDVCRVRDLARQNCSSIRQTNTEQQPQATCWTMSRSRDLTAPFAYDSEHWIGFDDETSVKLKAKYALLRHLAGVAMFTVNNDDPTGQCGFGPYPLLATVNGVLSRTPTSAGATGLLRHHHHKADSQRNSGGSFTRAPNQLLTATSLVSQIFSSSSRNSASGGGSSNRAAAVTPAQPLDLMSSASDEMPANHWANSNQIPTSDSSQQQQQQPPLMSFVDIIEKYGAVNRLDPDGRAHSPQADETDQDQDGDRLLACDKVGYQRYPRDCSRFYRCVQTPPQANGGLNSAALKPVNAQKQLESNASSTTTTTTTTNNTAQDSPNQNHATTSITRLQYECPSGLVFDEQYQICNWPSWSAQCTGSGEVNSITSTKFVCPNYGYFQNQENCEYFYYCSDYNRGATTQAYQFRCPFELGFDEEKLQCNWKWLVKGCSIPSPGDAPSAVDSNGPLNRNETNFELAKKYLSTLESSAATTTTTTTLAPIKSDGSQSASQSDSVDQLNATTTTTTTLKPTENVATGPTTIQPETIELSRTSNTSSTPAGPDADQQKQPLSRRSLELADEVASGSELPVGAAQSRAFVPALASHMTSLMASIEAIRQHRLKKASGGDGQKNGPIKTRTSLATTKSETTTLASVVDAKPARYPSFVGSFPQGIPDVATGGSNGAADQPHKPTSFRRRQTSTGSEKPKQTTSNSESDNQPSSVSASSPYKRRPPPASIFPFLPNSAVYMVADSLRSYGEAISDELNRYLRIAGDRVRDALGHRPAKVAKRKTKRQQGAASSRSDETLDQFKVSRLAQLARRLTRGQSSGQTRLSLSDIERRQDGATGKANANWHQQLKRVRRDTMSSDGQQADGDLVALESGAAPTVSQGQQYQRVYQQMAPQQPANNIYHHHRDSLGRPPGYPLNPLDEEAKRAVLGPEPKMFHQPQALVLNQLTGISQHDYDLLMRGNANNQAVRRPQWPSGDETMLAAASEQVPASVAFATPAIATNQQQQQQQQPFGMPTIIRPIQSEMPSQIVAHDLAVAATTSGVNKNNGKQRRRSTVAAKLAASLALPKLTSLMPQAAAGAAVSTTSTTSTTSMPPTTSNQISSKGYMSFLPSFTDVVAPARNIMNKAMGPFNRAVQELISTLSPSSSSNTKQPRPTLPIRMPTTPMPATTVQQQQQQQQIHNNNQAAHFRPAMTQQQNNGPKLLLHNKNRTSGSLLLTEDEARALSAQLDQLSKEQLEALSNDMFKHQPKQQMTTTTAAAAAATEPTGGQESPDYVVRLLKMLSQTSHNPEDIKLLDQLANSVNNPKPGGSDQSLIEIGQPDDLALLEALGMIPASQRPAGGRDQAQLETGNASGPMRGSDQDNQPEASYSNYQHQQQQQQQQYGHEMMKPGAMRPLLSPLQAQRQQQQQQMYPNQNQEQQRRHTFRPATNHPPLEIATGFDTTTKFVPVALDFEEPTSTYSPVQQQQHQQPYYNAPYYTTTTTTTTTPQPTELVTRLVQEQSLERVVPPVKQTFSEIIENNVTTPDGIETTVESRTKTAISGGASFDISSQLGLGMIPSAFGGSLPNDSPLSQQQRSLTALEQQQQQSANATDLTINVNTNSSTKQETNKNGTKKSTKIGTTKSGASLKLGGDLNLQQATKKGQNSFSIQRQQQQQQQQQLQQQQVFATTLAGMSGQRISSTSTTDQLLQDGAQKPLTSRTVTSSFSSARSQPNSVPATLSGYNFATQPVNQYEEVVIRKKFKPFPKTMIVPQESSFTVEEVRGMPQTQIQQQQQQVEFNQQQQTFPQQVAEEKFISSEDSATSSNSAGPNLPFASSIGNSASSSFGGPNSATSSAIVSSTGAADTSQEQIKEDEFSTIASTFGEQPPQTTTTTTTMTPTTSQNAPIPTMGDTSLERESLTSQELRQDQEQVAKDLRSIGQLLRAQEAAQLGEGAQVFGGVDGASGRGLVESVNLSGTMDELRKVVVPKSRKSKSKSQKQQRAATSTTTTTTQAPSTTLAPIESSTAKRSVNEDESGASESSGGGDGVGSRDRVEKAFTNFMVELKRTRRPASKNGTTTSAPTTTTTTTTTSTTTTTTSKPQTGGGDPKRKLRNKKQKQKSDLESSGSMRRATSAQLHANNNNKQRRRQRTNQRPVVVISDQDLFRQSEQVAVYGTKSGFMPIIRPDDPNYSAPIASSQFGRNENSLLNNDPNSDPLSFGASFTSSKQAKLPLATGQELRPQAASASKRQRNLVANSNSNRKRKQPEMNNNNNNSWRQYFARRLSDQISVVHLGNCSESGRKLIQVKLVILPASPNNQLLSEKNWRHLAASYPQLFPSDLQELNVETIDLGKTSISLSNGGLIDEHAEQRRHLEFKTRYEFVSQLIEPRTFKALDEIIQRSSGQMFMIQRKDSLDRTIIAVIPDRPFIRTAMSPGGGYQRLVIPSNLGSTTTTTTTMTPPIERTKQLNKLKASNKISTQTPSTTTTTTTTTTSAAQPLDQLSQSPQKAATFSRAIQESIQEAIKQHYDTVKSQLRQSMETTTGDNAAHQQQAWSTPAPETLAHMESMVQVHHQAPPASASQQTAIVPSGDPMETASSSTEYSVMSLQSADRMAEQPPVHYQSDSSKLQLSSSGYSQQAVFEVEGAEPKALYGLDLMSPSGPSKGPTLDAAGHVHDGNQTSQLPVGTRSEMKVLSVGQENKLARANRQKSTSQSRFISIGSHLIASPMKKIVDQAYVNHFYDHISGHQLAKSIGFDELVEERNVTTTTTQEQQQQQQQPTQSNESQQDETDHQLVPESACTRAGLFQHPFACNKFYECFWDKQLAKYTLHMFECPIKLAFDDRITGCAMPIESSLCVNAI